MKKESNKNQYGFKKKSAKWLVIAIMLIIFDVIAITFSYFIGLLTGHEFIWSAIPQEELSAFLIFSLAFMPLQIVFFWFMHMYQSVWRFTGFKELVRYIFVTGLAAVAHAVGITFIFTPMPFAYYVVGGLLQMFALVSARFSYRMYIELLTKKSPDSSKLTATRVMVIGAGAAGSNVVHELLRTETIHAVPCCIIDDNAERWNLFLEDVPVVGGRDDILANVEKFKIEQIYFCIPSASAEAKRDILNICKETKCELKILPNIYSFVNDEVLVSRLKPVDVEDLLGREPIQVNMDEICAYLEDKTILVTGGGGSIGSELCRQIANRNPKQLVIFDIYENNAYEIQQELKRKHPNLNLEVLIGSVRDARRINMVFERYKPDIVYHAAAHKHVPLMEDSPNEAIKNNVIGTYKTACAALKNGTKRFVLISTDKAVNPTNIMGASKRLCEMVVQSLDAVSKSGRADLLPRLYYHESDREEDIERLTKLCQESIKIESVDNQTHTGTQFVAVRFGNVLGSNGSVIPLFKKQIEAGGPVTVTHPDIVRYFMTIPEAVSLVLQAGTYAWGGEIFVLDMGEPVKIDTLARNLIKLSGYKPDEEIKIVYSGLRPGEKLYEEKLMAEEGLKKTANEMIFIGKPIPFEIEQFLTQLTRLADACYNNSEDIVDMVQAIVSTFHPVGRTPQGK